MVNNEQIVLLSGLLIRGVEFEQVNCCSDPRTLM